MQKFSLMLLPALLSLLFVPEAKSSQCHAQCSPHFTLPCTFAPFDKCLAQHCRDLCAKDGGRKMVDCLCRGTVEGPTFRACFCAGHKQPKTF